MATHVALIRGINVGGKNPVPMARLRDALGKCGVEGVRTYIQSGNVVLSDPEADEAAVADLVAEVLETEFSVSTVVVVVSADTLRAAVDRRPHGYGDEPETFHYDVAFLRPGLAAEAAAAAFSVREGVDAMWVGDGVVYFRRLSELRTKSRLSAVVSRPEYQDMTIRNWRTTTTLLAMLDDEAADSR